ncbi:bifunctional 3-(3-hydroxy-phenyl)propionate/3-hydroxycinnamic acid hydroxylase [Nonomuraea sp. NPDC050202]|uniref:bifunctional 3-(3-hydroxy-phenyl)propionate/3-hydroxycinnamic acid hydroxylase MhpA n=1 Tax=Nonomuraea sp. NPDC050202 TaxID=3155035 RepID=UPI0033FA955A
MNVVPQARIGTVPEAGVETVPVLVAGAGPTGVAAATLLAGYGVRSLVVDPHPGVYPLPRAVHLDDEVHRILQRMGVAEEFTAVSTPAAGMRLVDAGLRTIAEFRRDRGAGRHGWPQANMFDQPDLESLLRANLSRRPEVELLPSTEVVRVEQEVPGPARVRVLLRDAGGGREREVWAHAVLGCDGANSLIRRGIGARMRDLGFADRWLVVDVRCVEPLDVWDGTYQVCDPERAATFMRIGPERYRWEFRMREGETEAELTRPERLAGLLAPWVAGVPLERLTVLRQAAYTFRAQVADRWRRGRVFLLGDAAHLTPPFIGQGMGAGLRDAANLAWKLALVLSEGGSERLLDTYEAERAPHVTRTVRLAVTIGRAMTGGRERGASVRRLLLSRTGRLPAAHTLAARGTSPRLRPGPLVRGVAGLPGTLAPQPWVEVRGEAGERLVRLDDLLGDSFAVLALGPLHEDLAALARRLRAVVVHVRRPPVAGGTGQAGGAGGPGSAAGTGQAGSAGGTGGAGGVCAGDTAVVVADGTLERWLRDARTAAVLVRPDRVVLAAAPFPSRPGPVGAAIARDAAAWLPLLPPTRTARATDTPSTLRAADRAGTPGAVPLDLLETHE